MKNKNLIPVVALLLGGALGYYMSPTKVQIQTVTVEVEKKKTEQDTVIVEKTEKDGTKTKTTTVKTKTETQTKKDTESSKTEETYKPQYNISVMAGMDLNNLSNPIVFGIHAQKQFIGPINFGIFGFTNKTAGLSIGLQF
jgi:hypothetical protein